jgi:hypothetical protein
MCSSMANITWCSRLLTFQSHNCTCILTVQKTSVWSANILKAKANLLKFTEIQIFIVKMASYVIQENLISIYNTEILRVN